MKLFAIYNSEGKLVLPDYFVPVINNNSCIPKGLESKVKKQQLVSKDVKNLSFENQYLLGCSCCYASKIVWNEVSIRCPVVLHSPLPHQWRAITWMREMETNEHRGISGGILSLEMGLGKSLTSAFHCLVSKRGEWPTLIVCSKTLALTHWPNELEKFFGNNVKILVLTKDWMGEEINSITSEMIQLHDIVITTYDTCSNACKKGKYYEYVREYGEKGIFKDKVIARFQRRKQDTCRNMSKTGAALLYEIPWERIFCDESQKFANPNSGIFEAMLALYGKYKWCLTGTITRNYESDIWSQLYFCGYNQITNKRDWIKLYKRAYFTHSLNKRVLVMNYEDANVTLPKMEEQKIILSFSEKEKDIYSVALKNARHILSEVISRRLDFSCLLAVFTSLRKTCLSSYLSVIRSDEDSIPLLSSYASKNTTECDKWVQNKEGEAGISCTKINQLVDIINETPKEEKVLVFSSFSSYLSLVKQRLEMEGITYNILTGDLNHKQREGNLKSFKESTKVLLLTYKVGSEGLNLTEANHIICMEPWWNNAVLSQAKRRAWRIGQTKQVYVYNFIFRQSIEEAILLMCEDKDSIANFFTKGNIVEKKQDGLSLEVLKKILTSHCD